MTSTVTLASQCFTAKVGCENRAMAMLGVGEGVGGALGRRGS